MFFMVYLLCSMVFCCMCNMVLLLNREKKKNEIKNGCMGMVFIVVVLVCLGIVFYVVCVWLIV